jgi:hypothetical protein
VEYIKDVFTIEMNLIQNDIPYYECGIDVIDESIVEEDVEADIKGKLTDLVSSVSQRNPFVTMSLASISIGGSTIEIVIRINETDTRYEIKRRA